MNGFLNVLKPPGMSSSDVVIRLRRIFGIQKIGHTGTLDPGAAGVLSVAVGKATRVIEFASEVDKSYRCRLILGVFSDTDDLEGRITYAHTGPLPAKDSIALCLGRFVGSIMQTPPAYSAVKIDGKRAYRLAREGSEVVIDPRKVTVHSIEILREADRGQYDLDIRCGKGTYIRSLCRDIGEALGCGGVMGYLIRTRNGTFTIEESLTLQEIEEKGESLEPVSMEETLLHLQAIMWPESLLAQALSGRALPLDSAAMREERPNRNATEGNICRMYCGGRFVGVGQIVDAETGTVVKFRKMLA